MRKGWRWVVVGLVVVCLAGFFVFTAGRLASGPPLNIKALAGKRPISDKSQTLQLVSFGASSKGPSSIRYRVREFSFEEGFEAVNARFKAELKGRASFSALNGPGGSRVTMYHFAGKGLTVINATVLIQEKKDKTTRVTVTDLVEPNLLDRVGDWWDGVTGRNPAVNVPMRLKAAPASRTK